MKTVPFSPPDSLYRVSEMEAVSGQENVGSLEKISFLLYKILKSRKLTPNIQEEKNPVDFLIFNEQDQLPCVRGDNQISRLNTVSIISATVVTDRLVVRTQRNPALLKCLARGRC